MTRYCSLNTAMLVLDAGFCFKMLRPQQTPPCNLRH